MLWEGCESGITDQVQKAIQELSKHGVQIIEAQAPQIKEAIELFQIGSIPGMELKEFLTSELPDWIETTDPVVGRRIKDSSSHDTNEFLSRCRAINRISCEIQSYFDKVDLIVSPTVPISPPHVNEVLDITSYASRNLASLRNTSACNLLKLCGISMPAGLDSQGMPVGLQLWGPHSSDEKLLCIAYCFEKILGTSLERIGRLPLH